MARRGQSSPEIITGFSYLAPSLHLFKPSMDKDASFLDKETLVHEESDSDSTLTVNGHPSLILLFPWTGASPQHIAKYTSTYIDIYPSTPIFLITTSIADLLYRSSSKKQRTLTSAIDFLLHTSNESYCANILVHCFSEGGSHKAVQFAQAYQVQAGGLKLPISTLILDSTPGTPRFTMLASAFRKSLPPNPAVRLMGAVAAYSILGCLWTAYGLTNTAKKNVITKTRTNIDDDTLWDTTAVPRCYLYSEADTMIFWKDVEGHGLEARRRGTPVILERFQDSAHCCHVREDEKRYWEAVQRTWQSRAGL